jgi:hypothetical protein
MDDVKNGLNRQVRILIYECRCDERLKTKDEESTRLTYTGGVGIIDKIE